MAQPPKKLPKLPRDQLMFVDKSGEELWKHPNSLEGRQFKIANLDQCTVHVLDHTAAVSPGFTLDQH